MRNELTNLLPLDRQRALSREYLFRIGVIIAVLTTALTFSAAVLLIPTYVLLEESANAKNMQLTKTTATLSSADERALSARLTALSSNAATLVALSHTPSVSATVRAVLAIARPGITLSGFSYAPSSGAGKDSGTIGLSGVSATRDALRSYQLALQSAPFALSAALPVSAYAKDANIAFTITVTLSP